MALEDILLKKVAYPAMGRCRLLEMEQQRPDHTEKETKERAKHSPNGQRGKTEPEEDPISIQGQRYL